VLELFDGVFAGCALRRQLDNRSLDSFILETLRHKFTHKQLLLLNQVFQSLLALFMVLSKFLKQFLGALDLSFQFLVQVDDASIGVLLLLVLLVLGVNQLLIFLAGVHLRPLHLAQLLYLLLYPLILILQLLDLSPKYVNNALVFRILLLHVPDLARLLVHLFLLSDDLPLQRVLQLLLLILEHLQLLLLDS